MDETKLSTRVRTGCSTCRSRKVKCDETRPYCLRCKNTGRRCGGYPEVPARAKRKDAGVPRRYRGTETDLGEVVTDEGNFQVHWPEVHRPQEVPDCTSATLSSFRALWPTTIGIEPHEEWWRNTVLQIAQHEPAVFHALGSLNALLLQIRQQSTDLSEVRKDSKMLTTYMSGLEHYNQSIRDLRERRDHSVLGNESVMLICSFIFSAIEYLAQQQEEELVHLHWSMRFLRLHLFDEDIQDRALLDKKTLQKTLIPLFRLARRELLLQGHSLPWMFDFLEREASASSPSPSDSPPFVTLTEACTSLVSLDDEVLDAFSEMTGVSSIALRVFDGSVPPADSGQARIAKSESWRSDCINWLERYAELESFVMTNSLCQPADKIVCQSLRVSHSVLLCRITRIESRSETAYDQMTDQFALIVQMASELQQRIPTLDTTAMLGLSACFDRYRVGVIDPLWFVATKCRLRSTRRAALDLLSRWPHCEGLWSPVPTLRAARCVVEEEDPGAFAANAADTTWPPEEDRVLASRFVIQNDMQLGVRVTITMLKYGEGSMAERVVLKEC